MILAAELIFLIALFLIIYTYAGYYVVLFLIHIMSTTRILTQISCEKYPYVSFLIAAYNEEKNIINKINNIFESNYPQEKITVYIVSDASTDRTSELVYSCKNKRVRLIVSPSRRGKTFCENLGLKEIEDEYVIFTDASVMLDKDCVANLIKHFEFREIGCVSTCDKSIDSVANKGENLYVRYEMAVRRMEGKIDSLVGLSGSCYVTRRELCVDLPDYITRDFALPLIAKEKGFISIDEPRAICAVKPTENPKKEFARKIRTFTNGISTLFYKKNLLNIFRYGKFSFILLSHKLFRWMLPIFFFVLLLTNILLIDAHPFFIVAFFFQAVFYMLAFLENRWKSDNVVAKLSRAFHFICMTNLASIAAWYNFFAGNRWAKWEPTER